MTEISALVKAIMLLPVGATIDSTRAQLCLIHAERRGYKLVGLVHDWATALIKTRAHEAEVIILGDPADFQPDWTPRIEYCGEETQDLVRFGHIRDRARNESPSADGRRRRPGPVA